jgi:aspartate dehydrogenase
MRLALIGFGGIGSVVVEKLRDDASLQFVGIGARPAQHERIRALFNDTPVFTAPGALIRLKPDLVVECASHSAFREYAEPVLAAGIDLIAVSVGVLADADYRDRVLTTAKGSGAIGGIDAIAAARHAGLTRVTYITRKSPRTWMGTPAESMLDLSIVSEPVMFFDQTAERAALLFTEKANVTATLALAGIGFTATRVQFWADPGVNKSIHRIEAAGACGTLSIDLANDVAPGGKASLQTAMSITQAVRRRVAVLRI